jgi:hypothetical protein
MSVLPMTFQAINDFVSGAIALPYNGGCHAHINPFTQLACTILGLREVPR